MNFGEINEETARGLADTIATAVVNALKKDNTSFGELRASVNTATNKSACAKTEALLYNYMGLKRIVQEREQEIADIYEHGVPTSCGTVEERVQKSHVQTGIVLPEESVESAVRSIRASMQDALKAISMVEKGMKALRDDTYYRVLEYQYFECRTQEEIARLLGCSQVTVSKNKNRLVRELAMRIFPEQAVQELLV